MAEMPLMQCGSLCLTRIQAEIPWPVILLVRESSFKRWELVPKGRRWSYLTVSRWERERSPSLPVGPSKALRQTQTCTTHAATWDHVGPRREAQTLVQGRRQIRDTFHKNVQKEEEKHLFSGNPSLEINTFYREMLTSLCWAIKSLRRGKKKIDVHKHSIASKPQ